MRLESITQPISTACSYVSGCASKAVGKIPSFSTISTKVANIWSKVEPLLTKISGNIRKITSSKSGKGVIIGSIGAIAITILGIIGYKVSKASNSGTPPNTSEPEKEKPSEVDADKS